MAVSLLAGYPLFRVVHPTTGLPLAGGKVYTYARNTTTNKTAWTDAAKTAAHPNPIILDSAGESVIFWDGEYKIRVDDSLNATVRTMDDFNLQAAGSDTITDQEGNSIVNGSFEIDTDGDNLPDGWEVVQNGTVAFDTSDANHGGQSLKFTSVGASGGGIITSSSFFNVVQSRAHIFRYGLKVDWISGKCRVVAKIKWYTAAETLVSTTTMFSVDYTFDLAWSNPSLLVTPPATAVKAKIELTGISAGVTGVGSVWFDNLQFYKNNSVDLTQSNSIQTINSEMQFADVVTFGGEVTATGITFNVTKLNSPTTLALQVDDDSKLVIGATGGVYIKGATGTDVGDGTINAPAYHKNGVEQGVAARAYNSSTQNITTGVGSYVALNSTDFKDEPAMHDDITNNSRLLVPSGVTRVKLHAVVRFGSNSTGDRGVSIIEGRVNSYAAVASPAPTFPNLAELTISTGIISVSGGEYFEVFVWQDSGVTLGLSGTNANCSFVLEVIE